MKGRPNKAKRQIETFHAVKGCRKKQKVLEGVTKGFVETVMEKYIAEVQLVKNEEDVAVTRIREKARSMKGRPSKVKRLI